MPRAQAVIPGLKVAIVDENTVRVLHGDGAQTQTVRLEFTPDGVLVQYEDRAFKLVALEKRH